MGKAANLAAIGSIADTPLMFRNRIINGDMRIDQRNAGASITVASGSTSYPVDRMLCYVETGSSGTFTAQRSTVAPAGFTNSLLLTTATADSSITASEGYSLQHRVEGFNVADLGWGAAGAQSVTLSFWVRSSLTGTFAGSITNGSFNRAYVFTFTVNAANTFEYKTITISGDTGGSWNTSNGTGLIVYWSLGAGSGLQQTAGSWGGFGYATSSSVSPISTAGATFYITGVQLERGANQNPVFENRPYGMELTLCQRYFCKTFNQSVAVGSNAGQAGSFLVPAPATTAADRGYIVNWRFPVSMRAAPTGTTYNPSSSGSGWWTSSGSSVAATVANAGTEGMSITHSDASVSGQNAVIHATASAEL